MQSLFGIEHIGQSGTEACSYLIQNKPTTVAQNYKAAFYRQCWRIWTILEKNNLNLCSFAREISSQKLNHSTKSERRNVEMTSCVQGFNHSACFGKNSFTLCTSMLYSAICADRIHLYIDLPALQSNLSIHPSTHSPLPPLSMYPKAHSCTRGRPVHLVNSVEQKSGDVGSSLIYTDG